MPTAATFDARLLMAAPSLPAAGDAPRRWPHHEAANPTRPPAGFPFPLAGACYSSRRDSAASITPPVVLLILMLPCCHAAMLSCSPMPSAVPAQCLPAQPPYTTRARVRKLFALALLAGLRSACSWAGALRRSGHKTTIHSMYMRLSYLGAEPQTVLTSPGRRSHVSTWCDGAVWTSLRPAAALTPERRETSGLRSPTSGKMCFVGPGACHAGVGVVS